MAIGNAATQPSLSTPPPAPVTEASLPTLFEEQVAETPEAIALVMGDERISYAALARRVHQLTHRLLAQGAGPEKRIGIALERSPDFVIALLATLGAGAAYVPLDPGAPATHLARILADANPLLTLTTSAYAAHLPEGSHPLLLDAPEVQENLAQEATTPPSNTQPRPLNPDSPAWVIYTSGSTGAPKGVLGTVRGLLNRLRWTFDHQPYAPGEVSCQRTSLSFIDHVVEVLAPLLAGVPLVILSEEPSRNPAVLIEELVRERVTRLLLVPSVLRLLLRQPEDRLRSLSALNHWTSSGEPLSLHLARQFFHHFPQARLLNVYGSTEVSADATARDLRRGDLQDLLDYFRVDGAPASDSEGNIIDRDFELGDLAARFGDTEVPVSPTTYEEYQAHLATDVLPFVVDTSSPRFIGHMTSSLPSFMHELNDLISRLNQNVVKIETSTSLTFLERETLSMLHGSFFGLSEDFYDRHKQDPGSQLGLFTSGGSTANLAALWCARNRALPSASTRGFPAALEEGGYRGAAILCSRLAHYSVNKSASILGLGTEQVVHVNQEPNGSMDLADLERRLDQLEREKICVLALVGLAGATETGTVDPLVEMAEIAGNRGLHFHVDAAWGAPLIFSTKHRHLLSGIELADSITMCGHKQFYLPMGVSLCLFRDPQALGAIATSARYQAQEGSFDMGRYSPEGSRPALSLCFHAALHLLGQDGYARLMDSGIRRARYLEERIRHSEAFELLGQPMMNIVNYRYIPKSLREAVREKRLTAEDNAWIDTCNLRLQRSQFLEGSTFISRTRLAYPDFRSPSQVVALRAVLANPLTRSKDIDRVLENQLTIAAREIEGATVPEISTSATVPAYDLLALRKHTASIGSPLSNVQTYVLDDNLKPVPLQEAGGLYVAGDGLARGYFQKPRATAEHFLPNPHGSEPGDRMYRTGDRGRQQADGTLDFLGRADQQVKIEGFRIEPGEIEAALLEHPSVSRAAVIPRESPTGPRLVACVVTAPEVSPNDLRTFLAERLPEPMMPATLECRDTLPTTPNGKLDRAALKRSIGRLSLDFAQG